MYLHGWVEFSPGSPNFLVNVAVTQLITVCVLEGGSVFLYKGGKLNWFMYF